jgi:hypothetical protein
MYIPNESFGVNLIRNTPDGELHAERHMALCRAIDMMKLSIVLGDMVRSGQISQLQANAFDAQAGGLLATLLSENARSFIGSKHQSTAEVVRRYGLDADRIPDHVYWSREAGNFYDSHTNRGMGIPFYDRWQARKDDFPEKPTTSAGIDLHLDKRVDRVRG